MIKDEWITLKEFGAMEGWPSLNALRRIRHFYGSESGGKFYRAFRKIGRRVLINPAIFFEIIEKSEGS